jgi:hypothetical protein
MSISAAESAAGITFREEFRSASLLAENGGSLVGDAEILSAGLSIGTGQCDIVLKAPLNVDSMAVVIRFAPTFAWDDGSSRFLIDAESANRKFYVYKSNGNALIVNLNAKNIINVVGGGGTWSDVWNVNQENVLIVSCLSGATSAWLNGTLVGTVATTYNPGAQLRAFSVGSTNSGTSDMTGTTREVMFIDHAIDAEDEPYLRNETLISSIQPENSIITLPLERDFESGGTQVTPALGTHDSDLVLLGSDGLTSTEFPTKNHRRYGYTFDGGDQINCGDSDDFSFVVGGVDQSFSIPVVIRPTSLPGNMDILSKATAIAAGEFYCYVTAAGELIARVVDNAAASRRGKRTAAGVIVVGSTYVVVFVYNGSTKVWEFFVDEVSVPLSNTNSGVYTNMANTSAPLKVGSGYNSDFIGDIMFPGLVAGAMSQMQVSALTQTLRNEIAR